MVWTRLSGCRFIALCIEYAIGQRICISQTCPRGAQWRIRPIISLRLCQEIYHTKQNIFLIWNVLVGESKNLPLATNGLVNAKAPRWGMCAKDGRARGKRGNHGNAGIGVLGNAARDGNWKCDSIHFNLWSYYTNIVFAQKCKLKMKYCDTVKTQTGYFDKHKLYYSRFRYINNHLQTSLIELHTHTHTYIYMI